jgi:hypothetical protein
MVGRTCKISWNLRRRLPVTAIIAAAMTIPVKNEEEAGIIIMEMQYMH